MLLFIIHLLSSPFTWLLNMMVVPPTSEHISVLWFYVVIQHKNMNILHKIIFKKIYENK